MMTDPTSGRVQSPHGSPFAEGGCHVAGCLHPARHKVGEEDARPDMHNYTAYVCCFHFGVVMGQVAYSYCLLAEKEAGHA